MENTDKLQDALNSDHMQEGKFLSFQLGREEYAIEIRYITEIIGLQKITFLPDLPHYVKGVINLRGKVIPAIDVRLRFGFTEQEYHGRTCIIITNINEVPVGLIVDSVKEVVNISDAQIDPPPTVKKGSESSFISGLGKVADDVKIILDVNKLLYDDDLMVLESAAHV